MDQGLNWMLYQQERAVRERDERNRAIRRRFTIERALRACQDRCRSEMARARSARRSIRGLMATAASRTRRAVGLSPARDCCSSTAA